MDKATELELVRNITDNFHSAAENNDMAALRRDLAEYRESLIKVGVKDWELKTLDTSVVHNILRLIYSILYVLGACTIVILSKTGHTRHCFHVSSQMVSNKLC